MLDRAVETIPRETYTMYTGPTLWPQGFCVRQFNLSVRSRQGPIQQMWARSACDLQMCSALELWSFLHGPLHFYQ